MPARSATGGEDFGDRCHGGGGEGDRGGSRGNAERVRSRRISRDGKFGRVGRDGRVNAGTSVHPRQRRAEGGLSDKDQTR